MPGLHKCRVAIFRFLPLPLLCWAGIAQTPAFSDLHVYTKPGQQTGQALVTVNGKVRRVAQHALEAWPVMNGQNALILVLGAKKEDNGAYRLLYLDGETRKRRDLGAVPFASALFKKDVKLHDDSWAFMLGGNSDAGPVLIAADTDGIHGRVTGASSPQFDSSGKSLRYVDGRTGQRVAVAIESLLGADMTSIYEAHATNTDALDYVQFLRDGSAVLPDPNGQFLTGKWWTNGSSMTAVLSNHQKLEWPRTSLMEVNGVPAGTQLAVRLLHPLASQKAREGDKVEAVLLSPAEVDGKILLPQGSEFDGSIIKAHGVGWALQHETAALTLEFDSVKLTDGSTLKMHTRLYQVENAQETVNAKGTIQGIRSTGTPGHSAESKIASVAAIEPVAYLFSTTAATAALGFAEPEILYAAGTELEVQITAPLITSKNFPPSVPPLATSAAEEKKLGTMVRALPFRTATQTTNKPSDLTNLAFIGSADSLKRAFQAAGWVYTDQLTAGTTFQTLKTISGNHIYRQAPMSVLLLDERPPIFTLTKTTNTFSSRHHLRVFDPGLQYEGVKVLTSSSTQDIGIAFSPKQKTFIHVIDQYIDNERSKVVDDLVFTGCVTAVQLVPRSWAPRDAYNSTGDRLRTDGDIAVLRINGCSHPKTTPSDNAVPPARLERITRDTMLTLRNDIWRGNVGYQGVTGALWVKKYFATKDELKPESGAWRKADVAGSGYRGLGSVSPDQQPSARPGRGDGRDTTPGPAEIALQESHRWDPPHYEIGLQGGYLLYPVLRTESTLITVAPNPGTDGTSYQTSLGNAFDGGWTAGIFLTLNTWKWFSNQFTYTYERGRYNYVAFYTVPVAEIIVGNASLVTRQFDYNLLWNMRPPRSRWRPYLAGGPALILTALGDAPLKQAAGPFKLGLQNVGLLLAAFDFGSTPPLDGGGVFSVGLQYGGGVKFRILPRLTMSADFRETWSKNPKFLTDSYTNEYFGDEGYHITQNRMGLDSAYQQQRFTLGFAFTF